MYRIKNTKRNEESSDSGRESKNSRTTRIESIERMKQISTFGRYNEDESARGDSDGTEMSHGNDVECFMWKCLLLFIILRVVMTEERGIVKTLHEEGSIMIRSESGMILKDRRRSDRR